MTALCQGELRRGRIFSDLFDDAERTAAGEVVVKQGQDARKRLLFTGRQGIQHGIPSGVLSQGHLGPAAVRLPHIQPIGRPILQRFPFPLIGQDAPHRLHRRVVGLPLRGQGGPGRVICFVYRCHRNVAGIAASRQQRKSQQANPKPFHSDASSFSDSIAFFISFHVDGPGWE